MTTTDRSDRRSQYDQPCNGWANFATWSAAVWLLNDEELYTAARRAVKRSARPPLAAILARNPSAVSDVRASLRDGSGPVDWAEIAEALRED